jgi:hypothetical protein
MGMPISARWRQGKSCECARGVDGVQALMNALAALRRSFDRLKAVQSASEPYEFVFPKTLPMSYGLEFHRTLCRLVDEQLEKKERQLTRRRLARRKSTN